jgi:hypothetical protein
LVDSRPLICIVGGIGITPALGICRSTAASPGGRRVHVDYSASTREQVVCSDELRRLSSEHASITSRIRITREEGRLQPDELLKLAVEFPDSDWLVCGSRRFQEDTERLLRGHGIEAQNIHIESFRAFANVSPAAPATTAVLSPRQRTLLGYVLLAAIGCFAAQALFGLKWPLLELLQTKKVYSAITGTALFMLLMLQWRLAYARIRHGKRPGRACLASHAQHAPGLRSQFGGVPGYFGQSCHRRYPQCLSTVVAMGGRSAPGAGRSYRAVLCRFGLGCRARLPCAVVLT